MRSNFEWEVAETLADLIVVTKHDVIVMPVMCETVSVIVGYLNMSCNLHNKIEIEHTMYRRRGFVNDVLATGTAILGRAGR